MTLHHYFRELARYHAWATARLIDTHLRALTPDELRRDAGLFFGSVHGTLNHLLVAERIWQARVMEGQSPALALNAKLHEDGDTLLAELEAAARRWGDWMDGAGLDALPAELHYRRHNGEAVRVPLAPALGHIFNHGTHHRGQITAALTALGHAGPELDWIYLLQQQAREAATLHPETP